MAAYLRGLTAPRIVLWCYLIWYLYTVAHTFEPSPRLWLTSLGISGIIGSGLYLSTARSGKVPVVLGRWQVFRLFLMPFCVSSFAALIRDRGFVLVFQPTLRENAIGLGLCAAFAAGVWGFKQRRLGFTLPQSAADGWLAPRATPTPRPATGRDPCSRAR